MRVLLFLLLFSNLLFSATSTNVLLIITDDQGYGDLSLHGNPLLQTPRMDKLGENSIRLDEFYVSPVCAPTRASLLTGRYHLRTGAFGVTRRQEAMRPEEVTLGELFQANGFATGFFGKWHNGSFYPETPEAQGFDETLGFNHGHTTRYFDPVLIENGKPVSRQGYITDILTDGAVAFIRRNAEAGRPFFCYLSYNAPHTPSLVADNYYNKFKEMGLSDQDAIIYGMVDNLDENIGRVVDTLDEAGCADETLVIFMTDNGPNFWRYNAGMKGKKAQFDEGGVRVPFFIRWPGHLEAGRVLRNRLSHIDVLPTLVDLLDLKDAGSLPLDGKSFAPLLDDPRADWPDRLLYTFPFGGPAVLPTKGAVRDNRWLAVKMNHEWELYDLIRDPLQKEGCSADFPEVLERLSTAYEAKYAAIEQESPFVPSPIPVGLDAAPEVILEAPDASLVNQDKEGIRYNYWAGYAHNWITGWSDAEAWPVWEIDCRESGDYAVDLQYCLKEENAGVRMRVVAGDESLDTRVDTPFNPENYDQPFRIEGEAEKYASKPWKFHHAGTVHLPAGRSELLVRLVEAPGGEGIELKGVRLRKL